MRIKALSPGWRSSFEALLQSQMLGTESGNAGLAPATAVPSSRTRISAARGNGNRSGVRRRPLADDAERGRSGRCQRLCQGQYVVLRLPRVTGGPPLFRSYSLSGPLSTERYRISVKIEPNGAAGAYLREHVRAGAALDVSSPRGSFILQPGERPVVLLSAGIGATPVLAMLLRAGGGTLDTGCLVAACGSRSGASPIRRRSPPPHARAHARPQLCLL